MKDYPRQNNEKHPLLDRFNELKLGLSIYFAEEEIDELYNYLLDLDEHEDALFLLKYAQTSYPFSSQFKINEAEIYLLFGKEGKAIQILSDLEAIEPYNWEIYFMQATIRSQQGEHERAIELLEKCLDLSCDEKDNVYFQLALENEYVNNYKLAVKYLKKALRENPNNQEATFELALCYEELGKLEESIQFYQGFIDANPYSSFAWFNLGYVYSKLSLHEKALEAYDYAIVVDDKYISAYINKGNTLCILQRYQEAITTYQEIFEFHKPDSFLNYLIGEAFENMEEYELAGEHYKNAIQLDPQNADAWMGMGVVKDLLGNSEESLHFIKKAIEIDPLNANYWYLQGEVFQKLSLFEDSFSSYDRVIELDPFNIDIWLDYSNALFENGFDQEAINILQQAIDYHPGNADIYYRLTAYYLGLGKESDASLSLQDAIRIDYEAHNKLFEYMPHSKKSKIVTEILRNHRISPQ